ncbi:hypothetical protein F2Q69_00058662 [Brassica cretica]|uniref:Uncharacterized protein n=1 Tax=Brassica cretica TaxID=69181 RepID=A0A8S9RK52_BRACR|nr:hypothetical protein F2Q69_00058662 [Brassica cretica]
MRSFSRFQESVLKNSRIRAHFSRHINNLRVLKKETTSRSLQVRGNPDISKYAYDLFPGVPNPKSPIMKKAQLLSLKKGDHQQKSRFENKTSAWPKGSTTQKLERN